VLLGKGKELRAQGMSWRKVGAELGLAEASNRRKGLLIIFQTTASPFVVLNLADYPMNSETIRLNFCGSSINIK
jgi:hypothetical protein